MIAVIPKTPEEVNKQEFDEKWQIVNEYLENEIPNIENISTSGTIHTFNVKLGSIEEIKEIAESKIILDNHEFTWIQLGIPTFITTKAELAIVYLKWKELQQNKIKQVFEMGAQYES